MSLCRVVSVRMSLMLMLPAARAAAKCEALVWPRPPCCCEYTQTNTHTKPTKQQQPKHNMSPTQKHRIDHVHNKMTYCSSKLCHCEWC